MVWCGDDGARERRGPKAVRLFRSCAMPDRAEVADFLASVAWHVPAIALGKRSAGSLSCRRGPPPSVTQDELLRTSVLDTDPESVGRPTPQRTGLLNAELSLVTTR